MTKLNKKILYILVVCIVFAIIGFSAALNNYSSTPINHNDLKDAVVHVYILKDSNFLEASKILKQAGLVENSFLFCSLAIIKISIYHISAGEYKFNTSMTPSEMIDKLMRGENKIYTGSNRLFVSPTTTRYLVVFRSENYHSKGAI